MMLGRQPHALNIQFHPKVIRYDRLQQLNINLLMTGVVMYKVIYFSSKTYSYYKVHSLQRRPTMQLMNDSTSVFSHSYRKHAVIFLSKVLNGPKMGTVCPQIFIYFNI